MSAAKPFNPNGQFMLFDDIASGKAFVLYDLARAYHFRLEWFHDKVGGLLDPEFGLDARLKECLKEKRLHVGVLIDYEMGLPFQKLPVSEDKEGKMVLMGFRQRMELDDVDAWLAQYGGDAPAYLRKWSDQPYNEHCYPSVINNIHEAIGRGDVYQINFTGRVSVETNGSPFELYRRLRRQCGNVPYAALVQGYPEAKIDENGDILEDGNGMPILEDMPWQLSFSPELFLRIESSGRISSEPMKGTAPILGDGQDEARAQALRSDPKNLAENTMIVDLLRNDLGKIAKTGSVRVRDPFKVSAFGSVWQMTSTVEAELPEKTSFSKILQATFPCGSITGAPKRKSMELIGKLEYGNKRGIYTGSIGWLRHEPDTALGFSGCLNVAIRTLDLEYDEVSGRGRGTYGVGSGIVIDSTAESEYAELGWKTRLLQGLDTPDFGVFTTFLVQEGKLDETFFDHWHRLHSDASSVGIDTSLFYFVDMSSRYRQWSEYLSEELAAVMSETSLYYADYCQMREMNQPKIDLHNRILREIAAMRGDMRVRVSVLPAALFDPAQHGKEIGRDDNTVVSLHAAPLEPLSGRQKVCIFSERLPEKDWTRCYKTTRRQMYDRALAEAAAQGAFDALLISRQGYLLEGARSAVMIQLDGEWFMQPHEHEVSGTHLDILDSISARDENLPHSVRRDRLLTLDDVCNAQAIKVGNSLRGWLDVDLVV